MLKLLLPCIIFVYTIEARPPRRNLDWPQYLNDPRFVWEWEAIPQDDLDDGRGDYESEEIPTDSGRSGHRFVSSQFIQLSRDRSRFSVRPPRRRPWGKAHNYFDMPYKRHRSTFSARPRPRRRRPWGNAHPFILVNTLPYDYDYFNDDSRDDSESGEYGSNGGIDDSNEQEEIPNGRDYGIDSEWETDIHRRIQDEIHQLLALLKRDIVGTSREEGELVFTDLSKKLLEIERMSVNVY